MARSYLDAAACEMKRINARAAVDLQDLVSAAEFAIGFQPDKVALSPTDRRVREGIVVGAGDRIKRRGKRHGRFQFKPPALGSFLSTLPELEQFVPATRPKSN